MLMMASQTVSALQPRRSLNSLFSKFKGCRNLDSPSQGISQALKEQQPFCPL